MNTSYVYPSAQVGEFRSAMLYGSGPSSYSTSGDAVYNPGSGEYINFPSDCRSVSGNYDVRFVPTTVGLNQIRAGAGANGPSQSGWTAHWLFSPNNSSQYNPANFAPVGTPLSLGTLSAAGSQSTYTAAGLVTVATTTPPPLGSFVVLSNGASSYGIQFDGVMVYVAAVVAGTSFSFYFGQGSANHYTVNTDTLKWQVVQASATNQVQAQALASQITGVLATANLLTITQANSLQVGQFVYLNGPFKTASVYALGAIVQVASATSTGWTANWQGTIINQTSSETAVASLLVTNGGAPVTAYPYQTAPVAVITNITGVASATSAAGLLTLSAAQMYQAGWIVVMQNIGTATAVDGTIGTVISTTLGQTSFKVNGWNAVAQSSTADTGYAAVLVTGVPPSASNEVPAGTNLSGETVQFAALISSL